jgi:hypothetical protein
MNLDAFFTYLEHPETLNRQTLDELNGLNERYPYFQTARLLYLKNLHLLNDYRYTEELKKVSAYAGNRQVLYDLIHSSKEIEAQKQDVVYVVGDSIPKEPKTVLAEPQMVAEQVIEEIPVLAEQIPEPAIQAESIETSEFSIIQKQEIPETSAREKADNPVENIPSILSSEEIIAEENPEISITEEKVPFEDVKVEKDTAPEVYLEKQTISETDTVIAEDQPKVAAKESIADLILRKVAEIKAGRKEPFKEYVYPIINRQSAREEISAQQEVGKSTSQIVTEVNEIAPLIEETKSEKIVEIFETEKISISSIVEEQTEVKEEKIEPVKETPIFIPVYDVNLLLKDEPKLQETIYFKQAAKENVSALSMSFAQWLDYFAEDKQTQKKLKNVPNLIDDFIANEPRLNIQNSINTPSSNPEKPNSSNNEFEYVSETLADIYSKQGLTENAIIMYEKLGLKYPEKNTYFASRILELKQQNSNQ